MPLSDTLLRLAKAQADATAARPKSARAGVDPTRHEIAGENAAKVFTNTPYKSGIDDLTYRKRLKAERAIDAQADSASNDESTRKQFYKNMGK